MSRKSFSFSRTAITNVIPRHAFAVSQPATSRCANDIRSCIFVVGKSWNFNTSNPWRDVVTLTFPNGNYRWEVLTFQIAFLKPRRQVLAHYLYRPDKISQMFSAKERKKISLESSFLPFLGLDVSRERMFFPDNSKHRLWLRLVRLYFQFSLITRWPESDGCSISDNPLFLSCLRLQQQIDFVFFDKNAVEHNFRRISAKTLSLDIRLCHRLTNILKNKYALA